MVIKANPASGAALTNFTVIAPKAMAQLMAELKIDLLSAAAIMGNAGHESLGLTVMQELRPKAGKGGWGWFQWTGPRRRAFEAWTKAKGLDPSGYDANLGFLLEELRTTQASALRAVVKAVGLNAKTTAFEQQFERAGVPAFASRIVWANAALAAYNKGAK